MLLINYNWSRTFNLESSCPNQKFSHPYHSRLVTLERDINWSCVLCVLTLLRLAVSGWKKRGQRGKAGLSYVTNTMFAVERFLRFALVWSDNIIMVSSLAIPVYVANSPPSGVWPRSFSIISVVKSEKQWSNPLYPPKDAESEDRVEATSMSSLSMLH